MNYLDDLAMDIWFTVDEQDFLAHHQEANHPDMPLYRIYAVLLLTKGEDVTAEDVHNAWAAWAIEHRSQSKCIIPFSELSPEYQQQDEPYVEAIHKVRRGMR